MSALILLSVLGVLILYLGLYGNKNLLAPVWAYPRRRVPGAALGHLRAIRLSRARSALRNAGVARSKHMSTMEEAG